MHGDSAPLSIAAFSRRLAAASEPDIPLLVVRLPEFERVAWRRGLRTARGIERRATRAFARAVTAVLRAEDVTAHDAGSDVYLCALVARGSAGNDHMRLPDARSALARITGAVEAATGLAVISGWTAVHNADGETDFDLCIERALVRGAQERERFAFFSTVGHELRTPLCSIRGYLETVLDGDLDPATRNRFLSVAYDESLRLSRLVEGMFEISLLDLQAAPRAGVSGSLARAMQSARNGRDSVRMTADVLDTEVVGMAEDHLALVLVNLIENAQRHGKPGGRVEMGVDMARPDRIMIFIDDDGPGIPIADRERVFALGERGASVADGTGIGLAVVRLLVDRAGGEVRVADSPLGGARFEVSLPRLE